MVLDMLHRKILSPCRSSVRQKAMTALILLAAFVYSSGKKIGRYKDSTDSLKLKIVDIAQDTSSLIPRFPTKESYFVQESHIATYDADTLGYSGYDWNLSTEDNYASKGDSRLYGMFRHIRKRLDYSFHRYYSKERQHLQDEIIHSLLNSTMLSKSVQDCMQPKEKPWILFTAGIMGSGKSCIIHHLHAYDMLPLDHFLVVDPDEIRRLLPEFNIYLQKNKSHAGTLTQKEVGMMTEILVEAALERGQNVLKDGSLRDAEWYQEYFQELRTRYEGISLGIIHVTASIQVIQQRVQQRARTTGRRVPQELLEATIKQVPQSVFDLKKFVDYYLEIDNSQQYESCDVPRMPKVTSTIGKLSLNNQECAPKVDVKVSPYTPIQIIRKRL